MTRLFQQRSATVAILLTVMGCSDNTSGVDAAADARPVLDRATEDVSGSPDAAVVADASPSTDRSRNDARGSADAEVVDDVGVNEDRSTSGDSQADAPADPCAPMDVTLDLNLCGAGPTLYKWDGQQCVAVPPCACSGADCQELLLYNTPEKCQNAYAAC